MATCSQINTLTKSETLAVKRHGADWARTAEPKELRRLLWMDKVSRGNVLRDIHPISFACAVNPDYATGVESAEQLWEEMTGVPVEDWGQSGISLAFLDGALPVARERVGDIEIEPADIEQEEMDFDTGAFEEGLALGSEWAAKRANSSQTKYLATLDCGFGGGIGPLLGIADFGTEILIRSFLFMIEPNDMSPPYREIWLQMVGSEVSDPWDLEFAFGFVSGTLPEETPPEPCC